MKSSETIEMEQVGLMIARSYTVAHARPVDVLNGGEIDKQAMNAQSMALLSLVRISDEIARHSGSLDEIDELRWVPVAKLLLKRCQGPHTSEIFEDWNIDLQTELYNEALDPSPKTVSS